MIPNEKLDAVVERFDEISRLMSEIPQTNNYVALSREYAELEELVETILALRKVEAELRDIKEMMADPDLDAEMRALVQTEQQEAEEQISFLNEKLRVGLVPKDSADRMSAILEVRAGTGGDEAALFVGNLFRMYQRYSAVHGWKVDVLTSNESEAGGYKEIIASISGGNVFARLKFESGVHRVQRVPETESGGRIHTSAATVAILPEAEDVDIDIRNEDIRIDTMRSSGAGGQHVNTTDSAVRITHIPTGIVVLQSEKSQHQNRARGMQILRARLFDMERQKLADGRAEKRRLQVGSGDRSERIRTYNFPQGRVTDHRIGLTLYKLDQILAGDGLEEVVGALIAEHQATLLATDSDGE